MNPKRAVRWAIVVVAVVLALVMFRKWLQDIESVGEI